jgi:hypothetical protein
MTQMQQMMKGGWSSVGSFCEMSDLQPQTTNEDGVSDLSICVICVICG